MSGPIAEYTAENVLPVQATLGEGPMWDVRQKCYWWIDILEHKLNRFLPEIETNYIFDLDQMPGAVVTRKSGGLMLAMEHGFAAYDWENRDFRMVVDPEADLPDNRFNDGKCDPAGRFWAGTMRIEDHMQISTGSLYALNVDGTVTKHLSDVGVSNGLAWSKDAKKMYFIDSPRRTICDFDYDVATGQITNSKCVFETPPELGFPDGMTIDADDKLWVAFWGGWCVAQICPLQGKILAKIVLPVQAVSACTFGGPQLDELLITTASAGLNDAERREQPQAGDVFLSKPGARGLQPFVYAG